MIKYKSLEELNDILSRVETKNRIKEIRKEMGWTRVSLYKAIGKSEPIVRRWEFNFTNPRAEDLVRLSILFDRPIDEFLVVKKPKEFDTPESPNKEGE